MSDAAATILVVDDTAAKRYLLCNWLRGAGHTPVEAATAAEAFQQVEGVDLVVLDVRLPDMSGFEVCERLKADPATAALPVIQISAAAVEAADRARGLNRGADAYLVEPIDPEVFLATISAALRYYRARQKAEIMAARLAALTKISLAINSAESFDQLATVTAIGATEIFGVAAGILIMLPDGKVRRTVVRPGEPTPDVRGDRPELLYDLTRLVLGDTAGTGVSFVPHEKWLEIVPAARARDDVCVVLVRTKSDRPPICLSIQAAGLDGDDELNLARQLGQATALAAEALRSYQDEHKIALTLQQSMLPAALPRIPNLDIAVRYEPASDQAEVGGDFYEVLDLDGRVLAAIGDVQGHSLQAAIVMAELRHALRAFADEGHGLVEISHRLNSVLRRYHRDTIATVCLLLIDPADGSVAIANSGHIPLLLVGGGEAEYRKDGGLLLGFLDDAEPSIDQLTLEPGGTLVLVTDGLIEDRGTHLEVNLEELRLLTMAVDDDLEAFADRILHRFGPREDDVALLIVRRQA
jgi:serine phosphatase RsbU (regulator of sigma subunit)/CheY-like chemotaxis protein